jgi:hypothetical protein
MEAAMTTTQDEPCHFVTKIIDMFGDWFKQHRELNELMEYEFEFGELERVACDFNVSTADLERLVNRGQQSANELACMLSALDIDDAESKAKYEGGLREKFFGFGKTRPCGPLGS